MIVAWTIGRKEIAFKALSVYLKGVEAAKSAAEKVWLSTLEAQRAIEEIDETRKWLSESVVEELKDAIVGEERELHVPTTPCLTLRVACSIYSLTLSKLAEKEAELMVPVELTNERISDVRSLQDALAGQTEMQAVVAGGRA